MKKAVACSRVSLFPAEHGGAKNLRSVMEELARGGVECLVLVKLGVSTRRFSGQVLDPVTRTGLAGQRWSDAGVTYQGVEGDGDDLAQALGREIQAHSPDIVILHDDAWDESLSLFTIAAASHRLVFLAQTIHSLPFGPYAMRPSAPVSEQLRRAKQIVVPSRHVGEYIRTFLGQNSLLYQPNVFGRASFPRLGRRTNPYVTIINPCPWKGSSIFLKLARQRPDLNFAAVLTWGQTPRIVEQIAELGNVTVLPETPKIDEIFVQTRVLLVPSLCQEAFGLVAPEALMRGVPVIASDLAGLRESTLGAARLIPVEPLSFADIPAGDDPSQFVWSEPENEIAPWSEALDKILANDKSYETTAQSGRRAAEGFRRSIASRSVVDLFFAP